MFFPDLKLEISLKKIFILFLKEIKIDLEKHFNYKQELNLQARVLIN